MKYQGGKGRIARRIVSTITSLAPDATRWVEPFVGGAWVLDAADQSGQFTELYAGDVMEDVILLYKAVADGWEPPSVTTKQMFMELRNSNPSPLRALVGFGSSYGGTFFSGFCGDALNGKKTNAEIAAINLIKKRDLFRRTEFRCCDYSSWEPLIGPKTVVYCDPPYRGTIPYKGTLTFDSDLFWSWCQKMANRGASVFVSEYGGNPRHAEEVWSRSAKQTIARYSNKSVTERLFLIHSKEKTVAARNRVIHGITWSVKHHYFGLLFGEDLDEHVLLAGESDQQVRDALIREASEAGYDEMDLVERGPRPTTPYLQDLMVAAESVNGEMVSCR